MDPSPHVEIEPPWSESLPDLRVHLHRFRGARVGVGHRGLDALRARVVTRLRERLGREKDLLAAPGIAPFVALLGGAGLGSRRTVPAFVSQIRRVLRREPMAVENDAVDGAALLSLFYAAPVFLHDAEAVRPPLRLAGVPEGPALVDASGPLALLQEERPRRAAVHEGTRSLVFLLLDPGTDPAQDGTLKDHRIANWITTLTGGEAIEAGS